MKQHPALEALAGLLIVMVLVVATVATVGAQAPIKRPVKNPPQYPNIIDLEEKAPAVTDAGREASKVAAAVAGEVASSSQSPQSEALLKAVEMLAGEMRALVHEIRTMNVRQQTQLDITRVAGLGTRIDGINGELRSIRDRIATLGVEEQTISQLMTRESLITQTFNIGTLDREKTMEELRSRHEAKLRYLLADKERLQRTENDLAGQLQYYQNLQEEAEKRIQSAEELIRKLEESRQAAASAAEPKR